MDLGLSCIVQGAQIAYRTTLDRLGLNPALTRALDLILGQMDVVATRP